MCHLRNPIGVIGISGLSGLGVMLDKKKGKVYIVGAGPGEVELISLKALRILKSADVIVYDHLVNQRLLKWCRADAEKIYGGKQSGQHSKSQEKINALLIKKSESGLSVVRLKGGDPFVFGRGGEEAMALAQAQIDFEVVPGITSGIGALAYAGIPATYRGLASSVSLITGHRDLKPGTLRRNWKAIAEMDGTLVFYMGLNNLPHIVEKLRQHGKDGQTPVALVQEGTLPGQKTVVGTLDNILEKLEIHPIESPAVIIMGDVINLRNHLNWFERKPLLGKRIVLACNGPRKNDLGKLLQGYGAEVLEFPAYRLLAPKSFHRLDRSIENLRHYEWIVLTSTIAAKIYFNRLFLIGKDARELTGVKICAVSSATANKLREFGLIADLCQSQPDLASLIRNNSTPAASTNKILVIQSDKALPEPQSKNLPPGLGIDRIVAYRRTIDKPRSYEIVELIKKGDIDCIVFDLASSVRRLVAMAGKQNLLRLGEKLNIICIGIPTTQTAAHCGLNIEIKFENPTLTHLVNKILSYYNETNSNF